MQGEGWGIQACIIFTPQNVVLLSCIVSRPGHPSYDCQSSQFSITYICIRTNIINLGYHKINIAAACMF